MRTVEMRAAKDQAPERLKPELSFTVGCLLELSLLVLALVWGALFHRPTLSDVQGSLKSLLVGLVAALPPFAVFVWMLKSKLGVCVRHRHLFDSLLRPLFGKWTILQLFTISLIAGISEEALFRGAIQGSLADRMGIVVALILASGLFGVCHLLTWTYATIAFLIGVYLGWLWISTGNLLTPMITHAAYDFLALVYFLRIYRSR
jgi:membrane protease YdiL (CAAX protease family)